MYVLRLLLAATYLSTTKHPFDILVQLNNDEVPFAMVFADYILSIYVKQKDRKNNQKVYIIINRFVSLLSHHFIFSQIQALIL